MSLFFPHSYKWPATKILQSVLEHNILKIFGLRYLKMFKLHYKSQWPTKQELNPVSIACNNYCYSPTPPPPPPHTLDGMQIHCRITPGSMSPGWREATWSEIYCLRKHHSNEKTNLQSCPKCLGGRSQWGRSKHVSIPPPPPPNP